MDDLTDTSAEAAARICRLIDHNIQWVGLQDVDREAYREARDMIQALSARIRELEAQLAATCQREAATTKRSDDRVCALEAQLAAPAVKVKPGQIERAVWSAMIWAASNNPGFDGLPEYTDSGNSHAEVEARRAAARILAAIEAVPVAEVWRRAIEAAHAECVAMANSFENAQRHGGAMDCVDAICALSMPEDIK